MKTGASSAGTARVLNGNFTFQAAAAILIVIVFSGLALHAQGTDQLAQQWADTRVAQEQITFQRRDEQITDAEYQARLKEVGAQIQNLRVLISKLPRDQQTAVMQQQESLFQVRIVPLRDQWQQILREKQQKDAAQNAQIQKELIADAEQAGKFQAARSLLAEKARRGELSQAELQKDDQVAEQQVLILQRKYDAYGGNWGRLFSQYVASDAQKVAADVRLKDRLAETRTQIGQDAHRAADLTLSMQRNAVFVQQRAITQQQGQAEGVALKAQLDAVNAKYGRGSPDAADYNDRVSQLVQSGAAEQRTQWVSEAQSQKARETQEAANRRAAIPPPAPSASRVPPPENSQAQNFPRSTQTPNAPTPVRPSPNQPAATRYPPLIPKNAPSGGLSIAFLLVLIGGGGGYYFFQRSRRKPASPTYSALKETLQSSPPTQSESPAHTSRPVSPAPTSAASSARTLKERLFAEQKEKYQARYNDVMDEMTAVTADLARMGKVVEGIQENLQVLSKTVQNRVQSLIILQYSSFGSLALSAVKCKPVGRLYKRAGGLLKLAIIAACVLFIARTAGLAVVGDYVNLAVMYLLTFVVFFIIERGMQLKGPLAALRKNAEKMKQLSVAYVYDDQTAQSQTGGPAYRAIRVQAKGKNPPTEDFTLSPNSWGTVIRPEGFLLYVGDIAVYRVEQNGTVALIYSASSSEIMQNYSQMMTTAFSEQKSFAASTLGPLAAYAKVAWRRRRASEEIPRLEKLVQDVERLENIWRHTYVSDKTFDFLLRRIDLFNVRDSATPSGILLYGYPGNGKAHLAKKIAESTSARFEAVTAAMLNSPKEVKDLWERNRGKEPVVFFVDYSERVFPRPGSENEGAGTREATLAWVPEWAKMDPSHSREWVVMTAQDEQGLHPAILAQFGGSKIEVSSPDETGRELILRSMCRENRFPDALPAWLVSDTGGSSIHDLREIVKETKMQCAPNPPSEAHWRQAVKNVRGSDAAFKDETKTWDHLILPAEIKQQLQRACRVLREGDRYKAKGVDIPNILLFGPPGTGKTEIARTLANEGGVKFVMAGTADLKAQFTGQSAHLVRDIFSKARASAPAVLFIDEIEAVAAKRNSSESDSFSKDIVTEMLAQMNGARNYDRPVFVLAATNFPEQIDDAIRSRFTTTIEIPLPDEPSRCEMLKRLIQPCAVDPKMDIDEVCALLAKKTSRKSGRDLNMLVNRAMQQAVFVSTSADDLCLTREILLAEVAPAARPLSDVELQKVWSQIVLKPEVKETILSKIRMFNNGDPAAPPGLLLYGPTGTGKTEIARRIADSTSSYFMPLKASDLKAGYVGQSGQSVKKIWDQARSRERCIIFVDECDGVFGRRGSVNTDSGTEEVVPEFLASWDGMDTKGQIWVVGATNHRERLDEAIVGRFGAAIEIGMPEAEQRLEILRLEMKKFGRDSEIPDFVAALTTGFAGRGLSQMARDVCTMAEERKTAITPEMWKEVVGRYAKAGSESVDESARWDSLVVSADTLEKLQTICESLRQMEVLRKQGFEPSRGALLYGPPGTGKTQIARTIANESGLPFIAAKLSDIKAGWLGQSGQKVKELFERARSKAPCILFIDEIDAGCVDRSGPRADQLTNEIVTQMLAELDGVSKNERPVFLLAAANHPELMDEAILSRFIDRIEIPNPDLQQRRRLLKILLAKKPVDFDVDQVSGEVAALTGAISGRDIYSMIERASQKALSRALRTKTADRVILNREDLLSALPPGMGGASSARPVLDLGGQLS